VRIRPLRRSRSAQQSIEAPAHLSEPFARWPRRSGQTHDHVEVVNRRLDSEGAQQVASGQHVALRHDAVLDRRSCGCVDYGLGCLQVQLAKLTELQEHTRDDTGETSAVGWADAVRPPVLPVGDGVPVSRTVDRGVKRDQATLRIAQAVEVRSRTDHPVQPVASHERSSSISATTALKASYAARNAWAGSGNAGRSDMVASMRRAPRRHCERRGLERSPTATSSR